MDEDMWFCVLAAGIALSLGGLFLTFGLPNPFAG